MSTKKGSKKTTTTQAETPLTLTDITVTIPGTATRPDIRVPGEDLAVILGMVYERTTKQLQTDRLNLAALTKPECLSWDLEGPAEILQALASHIDENGEGGDACSVLRDLTQDLAARALAPHYATQYGPCPVEIIRGAAPAAAGGAR